MNQRDVYINISKIIERDSKSTTYKFALLRGVIDIIQDNSPFIDIRDGRAYIPMGLMVEKWILYYYPIFESAEDIPQIHGASNIAFGSQLTTIIDAYRGRGGFSGFYNDLKNRGIPEDLQKQFLALAKKIADTIKRMPMRYIGRSITNEYYSIFRCHSTGPRKKRSETGIRELINDFGMFSIPFDYYEAFRVLGSFINGKDSIFVKWAEFSVNASGNRLSVERVMNEVLKSPVTERAIRESKRFYHDILVNEGGVQCVWSGQHIQNFDVDHLIPFSVWRNNDLWNLLPARASINNKKRDKIPGAKLIDARKDLILHYWELVNKQAPTRFQRELQISLLGNHSFDNWHITAIEQLKNSCNYLINTRGFEEWAL